MTEACPQPYVLVKISCASKRRLQARRVCRRRKARRPSPPKCPSRRGRNAILLRTHAAASGGRTVTINGAPITDEPSAASDFWQSELGCCARQQPPCRSLLLP